MKPIKFLIIFLLFLLIIIIIDTLVRYMRHRKIEKFEDIIMSKKLENIDILNLKSGQKIMGEMFKEFDRICKSNNIKYWCVSGTLIGVVRHRGWVPWDSDIDVGMLENDYKKFKKIAKRELPENLWLQDTEIDRRYRKEGLDCVKKIRHLNK